MLRREEEEEEGGEGVAQTSLINAWTCDECGDLNGFDVFLCSCGLFMHPEWNETFAEELTSETNEQELESNISRSHSSSTQAEPRPQLTRRQEAGGRRQEAGGRRQEAGGVVRRERGMSVALKETQDGANEEQEMPVHALRRSRARAQLCRRRGGAHGDMAAGDAGGSEQEGGGHGAGEVMERWRVTQLSEMGVIVDEDVTFARSLASSHSPLPRPDPRPS
eukprot:762438-Hanusia_phi.AAC.2